MDPNVNIVGVTVLEGNVDLEQSTKNALMALELAGCDVGKQTSHHDNRS